LGSKFPETPKVNIHVTLLGGPLVSFPPKKDVVSERRMILEEDHEKNSRNNKLVFSFILFLKGVKLISIRF